MTRKPPPKTRHRERPDRCRSHDDSSGNDPRGYNAPGHTAGQFEDSGYGSGHGTFGFTHDVNP